MYWCGNSETSIGVRGSRGKAPKRRQWRKKRGAFEAAARLARPKERGNRFAATVDKPPRSWGFKGGILFNQENIPFDIALRGAAKTAARRRREGRVVDLGTATRERGGKAGYAENMSRAAAVNAQRERVLLFSLSSFCDPFRAARL
nr:MAG TPA: hypothetical protein [Caudoviricetes sp.]